MQDHERCLWCQEPQDAMQECGITVVQRHPTHSPDLNCIENAWAFLRARLAETLPARAETRQEFVRRLRVAVVWVNRNQGQALLRLGLNQKERAAAVLEHQGCRIPW